MTEYDISAMPPIPAPTVALVERITQRVPELGTACVAHHAEFDEILPHVFFGDVTRWVVGEYQANRERDRWRDVLAFLEDEYAATTDADALAVIEQSFVENLPYPDEPGHGIEQELGPRLRAVYAELRPGDT